MLAILRSNPPLRRLLAAWAQSCLGTGVGYVALLLLAYRHLHTPWAIAGVLLAEFLPAIAFGSWFGSLADRLPKRRLIVAANLIQAAAYGGLALSARAVPIVALALLAGVGLSLERPALRSALPIVAGEARQVSAALYDTLRWIGVSMGPLIAAGLFAFTGVAIPLALNGLSFLVAAAAMTTVAIDAPTPGGAGERAGAAIRAGLRAALTAPGVATVVGCSAGGVVAGGLLNVCEPIFATRALRGSASDYALLVACYGAGMALASALVARRGDAPGTVLVRRYVAALTLSAVGMTGSAVATGVAVAALAFAATGYANALQLVSATQLIQLRVASSVQGRLFGARDTLEGACFVVGLVAGPVLVDAAGVRLALLSGAAIWALCALVAAAATQQPAVPERAHEAARGPDRDVEADGATTTLPQEPVQPSVEDSRRSA